MRIAGQVLLPASLLAVVLTAGCAREPVDRFCAAARRASEQVGWADAQDQPERVAAAWRGESPTDPLAPILEFDGLRPWHRAGALDELAPPDSARERRCAAARIWLAEDSWRRFGLVVAVEDELLVVIGQEGSPDEPDGWPPTAEELERGRLAALHDAAARQDSSAGRASLHLPARDDLTFGRARLLVDTLKAAGYGEPDVYFTDRQEPVSLAPSSTVHEAGAGGPEQAGLAAVEVTLEPSSGGVEARAWALLVGLDAAPGRRVPLVIEEGEPLAVAGPEDHGGTVERRLQTGLDPFELAGLPGSLRVHRDVPVIRAIEALAGMRGVGLDPVSLVEGSIAPEASMESVRDAVGLRAAAREALGLEAPSR